MGEWRQYRLADVGRIITGKTPPTSNPSFYGYEIPFVTPTDMDGRRTIDRTARRLSRIGAEKVRSSHITDPAVVVSCIGSDMGKVALVNEPFVSNQQINSLVVDAQYDRLFVYYNLSLRKAEIRDKASGAAQPIMNKKDFGNLILHAPGLALQQSISSGLGALDDKIELNRRMNETLEAMARAIFKDWFVDFDPTRAKMEGRLPYLSADLWSLFPHRLDDDGKPEGWSVSAIGKEVAAVGGSTPSTEDLTLWDGGISWATPKDLSGLDSPVLLETRRTLSHPGLAKISSGLLPPGTVLLSSRAPVGYVAISEIPVAINQGFIAMRCTGRLSNIFVWLWTVHNLDSVLENANGSTFQEISKCNFRPIRLLVPAETLLAAFESAVRPLYQRMVIAANESRELAAIRDLLLPKLMSGEIRLRDAEKAVEAAL